MVQHAHKHFIKKLLSSKVFLFCIVFILIALIISLGQESYRKYQLTKEINKLKLETERIENRNQQLANLMEYFKEESYLEKQARLKLNLKKPGEKVVVLPQVDLENNGVPSLLGQRPQQAEDSVSLPKDTTSEEANWWKWWEYFFGQ